MHSHLQELLEGSIPDDNLPTTVLEGRARAPGQPIMAPPARQATPLGSGHRQHHTMDLTVHRHRLIAGRYRTPRNSGLSIAAHQPHCHHRLATIANQQHPTAEPADQPETTESTEFSIRSTPSQRVTQTERSDIPTLVYLGDEVIFNPEAPIFTPRSFVPTTLAMYGPGNQAVPTLAESLLRLEAGIPDNYRGDPNNRYTRSVPNLPDEDNCAFWICNLPPRITHHELLGAIIDCGRVFCLHINKEEVRRFGHAAAKLVFFDTYGARSFAHRYMANQTLYINGRQANIRRNRHRIPAQAGLPDWYTRCLRITGPSMLVNIPFLFLYFQRLFRWETQDVHINYVDEDTGITQVEFRFGSYRAQAAIAYRVLTEEPVFRRVPGFEVTFAYDPCGP